MMHKEDLAFAKLILKSYLYTFLEKFQFKSLKVFAPVVATYIATISLAKVLTSRDKK